MGSFTRMMVLAAFLLVPARSVRAQPNADPSGHWEGKIQAPGKTVAIEIDLVKNTRGELVGTFGNPTEGEKGLPLASAVVVGRTLTLVVNAATGGGTFHGILGEDGRSITGEVTIAQRGAAIAFQLTRTGEAKIAPPPKSAPIARRFEGSWTGALAVEGKQLPIVLTMANQPDGTATGTIGAEGLQLPIAMTQKASSLRIDVPSVTGSYAGVLNDAGTELVGTWTQRSHTLPLTLRRDAR